MTGDLRIDLVVPRLRFFGVDPIAAALGEPIDQFLAPLLAGPASVRTGPPALDVVPLRLPNGEGMDLPIGPGLTIGFVNDEGELLVTVPTMMAAEMKARAGAAFVSECAATGGGRELRLRLTKGMRLAMQLNLLGEIAVEVP